MVLIFSQNHRDLFFFFCFLISKQCCKGQLVRIKESSLTNKWAASLCFRSLVSLPNKPRTLKIHDRENKCWLVAPCGHRENYGWLTAPCDQKCCMASLSSLKKAEQVNMAVRVSTYVSLKQTHTAACISIHTPFTLWDPPNECWDWIIEKSVKRVLKHLQSIT